MAAASSGGGEDDQNGSNAPDGGMSVPRVGASTESIVRPLPAAAAPDAAAAAAAAAEASRIRQLRQKDQKLRQLKQPVRREGEMKGKEQGDLVHHGMRSSRERRPIEPHDLSFLSCPAHFPLSQSPYSLTPNLIGPPPPRCFQKPRVSPPGRRRSSRSSARRCGASPRSTQRRKTRGHLALDDQGVWGKTRSDHE